MTSPHIHLRLVKIRRLTLAREGFVPVAVLSPTPEAAAAAEAEEEEEEEAVPRRLYLF